MADPKKVEASPDNGHSETYKMLMYIFILMVLATFFAKLGIDQYAARFNENIKDGNIFNNEEGVNGKEPFHLTDLFPQGKIILGQKIITKKELAVRNFPAGQLLGLQARGQISRVLEGPVSANGADWWRMDFKDAPDGWVRNKDVSAHVFWFNFINFFPWLFNSLQKVLILIGLLALFFIIIVNLKFSKLRKLQREKEELKKEQNSQTFKKPGSVKEVEEKQETDEGEDELILPVAGLPIGQTPAVEDVSNRRWKNVQSLINSHNLNDWRQAIIESDIMLDEMLDKMGYHGNSVGEKLKQIEESDFLTLNQAWEAHKVRNQIAHKGGNYILSKDEAERVIKLYSEVFKEFYYI